MIASQERKKGKSIFDQINVSNRWIFLIFFSMAQDHIFTNYDNRSIHNNKIGIDFMIFSIEKHLCLTSHTLIQNLYS